MSDDTQTDVHTHMTHLLVGRHLCSDVTEIVMKVSSSTVARILAWSHEQFSETCVWCVWWGRVCGVCGGGVCGACGACGGRGVWYKLSY